MATRREEKEESQKLIRPKPFLLGLTMQEALFLGFCATFIVIARAALRLHLKIPGHAMLFTMFFLMLGRACIDKRGAATLIGLVAGCLAILLGMGKGGPLVLLKFVLPAMLVDLGAWIYPGFGTRPIACLLIAMAASATRAVTLILVEWLIGVETVIMLQHAVIATASGMAFGAVGGLLVPYVARRFLRHGLISHGQ